MCGIDLEHVRLDVDLGQIDQLHAELLGQDGQDVFFLGETLLEHDEVERTLRLVLLRQADGGKVAVTDKAVFHEKIEQVH